MATRRDNPTCVVHLTTAHLGFVAMLYSTRPGRALHIPVAVYGATVWYGTGRTNERTTSRSARPAGKQPIRNEPSCHPHSIVRKKTKKCNESMARIYLALYPRRFSTHTQRKRVDRRCVPLIDEEEFFLYRLFFSNF
jgi:hypothetical protein